MTADNPSNTRGSPIYVIAAEEERALAEGKRSWNDWKRCLAREVAVDEGVLAESWQMLS